MKKVAMVLTLLTALVGVTVVSGYAVEIDEADITTAISARQPVDSINSLDGVPDKLYCYTRVSGAVDDTWITHVWYWQGREMARVSLPVRSDNWRTWSSKRLEPQWRGNWRVEVLDAAGNHLLVVPFSIE